MNRRSKPSGITSPSPPWRMFLDELWARGLGRIVTILGVRISPVVAFFWLACTYSAFRLYGYYHVDELGQVTMFCLYKLGLASAADLPWEFAERMRPWLQPALYTLVVRPWIAWFGFNFVTTERLMVLVQWVLVSAALPIFVRIVPRLSSAESCRDAAYHWGTLAITATWFVPSMVMRHSSEAFAVLWLAMSLGLWQRVEDAVEPPQPSLSPSKTQPGQPQQQTRQTWRPALAGGLAAGFAFASRYQVGLWIAGFFVARLLSSRHERRLWRALAAFASGIVAVVTLSTVIDWWGYGALTFAPWNYLRQNVLQDRASQFGRSPWYYFFVEASVLTLNPFFFLWLGRAIVVAWRNAYRRAVAVGVLVFFAGHLAIPHKEIRFLLPLWPPVILLLLHMFATDASAAVSTPTLASAFARGRARARPWAWSWEPIQSWGQQAPARLAGWLRPLWGRRVLRLVAIANVVVLVGFSIFSIVRDRYRVDLALWELPVGTTVLASSNLYRTFDETLAPPPEATRYSQPLRRPPFVRLAYTPAAQLSSACAARPDSLVLLTNQTQDPAELALLDRTYQHAIASFPTWSLEVPWLVRLQTEVLRRMWRFKLVACSELEPR